MFVIFKIKNMDIKTIITVSETADRGKSLTLNKLGSYLVSSGANTAYSLSNKDYYAVFNYKGVIVGVQTFGDTLDVVRDGLRSFQIDKCDIILIATKRHGETVKEVESFANNNAYRVVWTAPYKVWDGQISVAAIKEYTASHLMQIVNDCISGKL
jgi:hypothetical protein